MISFPPGTEIFQFPGFASTPYVFRCRYLQRRWVSPFGHHGINARCQLHRAFRRLPRPSSPLTAKASTVCACSLDHITPSRLGIQSRHDIRLLASTTHLVLDSRTDRFARWLLNHQDRCRTSVSPDACYVPSFQRTRPDLNVEPLQILWCALDPELPYSWWVWEDSNHRPHPYQGCALTT